MTNITKSLMVAAAALTLAGVASAQTLKAEIPFAFTVTGKLMQPGTYEVSRLNTGARTIRLLNMAVRESALAVPNVAHDPAKEWKADGKARLAFECGSTQCALSQMWNGDSSSPAQSFRTPRSHRESMHVAVIIARPIKAD